MTNAYRLRSCIALALLSLLFVACGDSDTPDAEGTVTVRLSHWWGDSKGTWDSVIAEFERSHPKIRVEQEVMSFNVLKDKVLAQSAAGGSVGDLVPLEDWFAQELIEREFFVDISTNVDRDLDSSKIFAVTLESFRHGNTLQAFPLALATYPLVYNREIFDKAGIRYPDSTWTYDTLLAVAKSLTKDVDGDGRVDQYGLLLDNSGGFDGAIWSLGGAVLTDDLQRSAFAEPRTIQALQWWVDLVGKHGVAPQSSSVMGGTSAGGSMRPFETGRFAMALMSPHAITPNTTFAWDIVLPPRGPAGRKALRGAAAFGIPKGAKHPEEAWEFIRWIVEEMPPHYAARLFPGQLPNSRRIAASDEYRNAPPRINKSVLADIIDRYSFAYWRSGWVEFRDGGFLPELDLMVSGEKTVEQGARDADTKINAVLSRAGSR